MDVVSCHKGLLLQTCIVFVIISAVADVIGHSIIGGLSNDFLIVYAGISDVGNGGKFRNHHLRIGWIFNAGFFHQRDEIILETYGNFRMFFNPAREKDSPIQLFFVRNKIQGYIGSGGFCPCNLIDAFGQYIVYAFTDRVFHGNQSVV